MKSMFFALLYKNYWFYRLFIFKVYILMLGKELLTILFDISGKLIYVTH